MELKNPIQYAQAACDTMMRKYAAADLPPKGRFHYHQGVFLSGMYQTYLLTQDERYFQYIKDWVDSVVDAQGAIHWYEPGLLDDMQPGILLFPLYQRTGDARYRKALDTLMANVAQIPRNTAGGLWHKLTGYDTQMWLDGLYMAGPICAEYGKRFDRPDFTALVVEQARLMVEKTRDPKTGLLYHVWDESKKAAWADPETGCSAEFWGRSIGWVPVALLDDLDFMDPDTTGYKQLTGMTQDLLSAVCKYQSADGRWYQVVDKGDQPGNWLENSCSCLFTAALAKGMRKALVDSDYTEQMKQGYEGVIRNLSWQGEDLLIGNVCIGTDVGDYQHYCDRPVSTNDLHGVGAFLLMCTEVARALNPN